MPARAIYYDPIPNNLTAYQLSKPPYDESYSQGTFIGGVLPMPYYFEGYITIKTGDWTIFNYGEETSFKASFDLTEAFERYGTGIYTLIIWAHENYYTTVSIWN